WPLRRRGPARCRDVIAAHRGRALELVAWSISRKDVSATYDHAADGSPLAQPRFESMAFVTLEDETALVETTWFPDTYRRYAVLLERREPLTIAGVVEVAFGFATLRVDRAWVVR
ncbi:MAG: hypothetical protein H0W72_07995, partial [Planctomycetes bacterium]|nr:hypothetical protein [Planctomycetota bacterium]